MKVIIVDDEAAALVVISSLLSKYDDVHIVGSYQDPMLAIKELEQTKPRVVFLDMEMGAVNGLEIAEQFYQLADLQIVFVTAYSRYAVDAFEVNAIDYLLKPVQQERLDKAIQRLRESLGDSHPLEEEPETERMIKITSLGKFVVYSPEGEPITWSYRLLVL